jgi:hypothetical protein
MTSDMELVVAADGVARCIYDEGIDLRELGQLQITRASHVEPDAEGYWWADMGPSGGPVLGPYGSRSEALEAERGWLAVRMP